MVTLKDEISSQENMEQWMSQLGHPENPISNKGVLVRLQPQFFSCDFEKRENCIAIEALPWEQNPGGTLHGGSGAGRWSAALYGGLGNGWWYFAARLSASGRCAKAAA